MRLSDLPEFSARPKRGSVVKLLRRIHNPGEAAVTLRDFANRAWLEAGLDFREALEADDEPGAIAVLVGSKALSGSSKRAKAAAMARDSSGVPVLVYDAAFGTAAEDALWVMVGSDHPTIRLQRLLAHAGAGTVILKPIKDGGWIVAFSAALLKSVLKTYNETNVQG